MVPFHYHPLDKNGGEVRLLTLLPGRFASDIRILITNVSFSVHNPPFFEVLSYTWGSQENPVDILVGPEEATLKVTRNLAEALPYLRLENQARTMWIDAICIDQSTLEERSSQVTRMGDIYTFAHRVVIWLGPERDGSTLAINMLKDIGSNIAVDWTSRTISPSGPKANLQWADKTIALPYKASDYIVLKALFQRAWFGRLWIWQEARHANSNSVLICGYASISWKAFGAAIFCLARKRRLSNIPGSLAELLKIIRVIYALLSIRTKEEAAISIKPDYTRTTGYVYINGQSLLSAYCLTICGTLLVNWASSPKAKDAPLTEDAGLTEASNFVKYLLETPDVLKDINCDPQKLPLEFLRGAFSMLTGRSFFTSEEGYIGLGPPGAEKGDVVCVLLGCASPMLLRRTSQGWYQVVGECFVLGLVGSEALLGPVPELYRLVYKYSYDHGCYIQHFFNKNTGETSWSDPRLNDLPLFEGPDQAPCSYVRCVENGYLLTSDAYTRMGAKIEDFLLV
ncbi:HET-domain-containing protein [Mollisia scopiformis]|uniref:HET-domain-containing protein n=1 Tax=Mollisia scopiformis TaxID=149040 RepID=A0A132BBF3_MOLSC|nr:HET-domain-containing protein [Mollisia scopiformis]KUJ09708.1 HET-domain-containing protein [Mollisia scopiformis]